MREARQLTGWAAKRGNEMAKQEPIRVGDKFSDGRNTWKVIGVLPGGKLELFDKERCYFSTRYHREVREWTRVN